MVEKTLQRFGKIDVLVNNAAPKPIEEIEAETKSEAEERTNAHVER
jgi:NAD(P)-dependent dehydrogenase (short-subunit alcohol dehydrogenase family)